MLSNFNIHLIFHYAPLHYLPLIARSRKIRTKTSLQNSGFNDRHFRSTSHRQDRERGFGDSAFLTLHAEPNILLAKLRAGFPHINIRVPSYVVDSLSYSLCRYNIAKTRVLRRNGSPGRPESPGSGRYYEGRQIPTARSDAEKKELLNIHLALGTMIEVIAHEDISLPDNTEIEVYSLEDLSVANHIATTFGLDWAVALKDPPCIYRANPTYMENVRYFISKALELPEWRGNGLEFDRV